VKVVKNPITLKLILAAWLGWVGLAFAKPASDPFADVKESEETETSPGTGDFFTENFGFRKELMSQFGAGGQNTFSSRQSVGFEVLKKFSSETATLAGLDFQGRLVRRDGFVGSLNDMEGMDRPGWFFEVHNAYADFYNLLGEVGRFNLRVGRFYLPFGLNLQTDTHGTILQLSNERNFGFERDWVAGFWGSLGALNYDVNYLVGSGYGLRFEGQGGMGAARISLGNRALAEDGLEGGLSFLSGGRLSGGNKVDTIRGGLDGRWRTPLAEGLLTLTTELSAGQDAPDAVFTQFHQIDYLHESRRWGLATQFRRFWREGVGGGNADSSLLAEATWYFRNDVGSSNLQWVKLNVEWPLERQMGVLDAVVTLQYYQYW
jgi:hypothetical protein